MSLVQDPVFCRQIEKDLDNFFLENVCSTDRIGTVWEASKAYIRGKIIAQSSKKKREQAKRLKDLETQLKDLEKTLTDV